jgi:adenine deaminase
LRSDAGDYPHGENAREFATMVKMGLPRLKAIQAATVNAADLIGWSKRVGTLEVGNFADIVAVEGNPLADVSVLEKMQFVMKGGQVACAEARVSFSEAPPRVGIPSCYRVHANLFVHSEAGTNVEASTFHLPHTSTKRSSWCRGCCGPSRRMHARPCRRLGVSRRP